MPAPRPEPPKTLKAAAARALCAAARAIRAAAGLLLLAGWLQVAPVVAQTIPGSGPRIFPSPSPAAPPARTEAGGPGPVVEQVAPGQAEMIPGFRPGTPTADRVFQGQLPPELRMQPPSEAMRREYQRFVTGVVDPQEVLNLIVGRPRILTFAAPPKRLYIPDNRVARWDIISETEVAIVGQEVGSTSLTIWVPDSSLPEGVRVLSYLVRVLEDPQWQSSLDEVQRQINEAFPDSFVQLSLIRDRLIVRGEAKDALEAAQILSVLAQTRRRTGAAGDSNVATETNVLLDQDSLLNEDQAALRRSVLDVSQLNRSGIINLLRVPGEQQVMLRVTVAEVNREAARSIGLDFRISNNQGTAVFESLIGGSLAAAGNAQGLANMLVNLDNGQVEMAINALRNLQLSRTLAEPNLTTLNGRPASFQAGGSFPVPVVTGATATGLQGVQFVPFGVLLDFTPVIVDRDRIRLQIRAEVSVRDDSIGTTIGGGGGGGGGTSVAGLNTRNFTTTVELREGQTLAVAGLIQNNLGAVSDRVPLWGDLPLIGHTGGRNRTTSGEQELVILVTPELVHPLEACQTPPLPGSDVFEPTDIEFFLGNRLESRRMRDYRSPVRTDWHRLRRVQRECEDLFIIGPSGHTYGCCGQNRPCMVGELIVPGPLPATPHRLSSP